VGIRIGVDTGGTFTDVVIYDDSTDQLTFHKVHSTPDDPGRAVLQGCQQGLVRTAVDRTAVDRTAVELLVHGTTVATNTLLQRRGAKAALVTTVGFRDVLHIQRQNRPRLYDLRGRRTEPLIPRCRRFELTERIGPDGTVEVPVDMDELERIVDRLRVEQVEAVAVAFLHSYENPAHELMVAQAIGERLPAVTVCTSFELVQQIGEYERFSTCSVNAFVQPVMERYLGQLDDALKRDRMNAPLFVMKSNGGVMSASAVARQCVHTILSGPAGGIVAGVAIARHHEHSNLITADMGGTSFDVAVIENGKASFARDSEIDGIALRVPMLDLHTVGAGGGSIGWVDAGGALRVGPQSAGAVPGPACYGLGGTEPTVTDANLALGRLTTDSKIAGGMELDLDAARRTIDDKLAKPLNLSIETAAEGMLLVVNATMVAAIRKLTLERGLDPRTFVLCPFGGAGPLHGAELARECGIRQVLVPLAPGVTSAMGLLMSNLREDLVATHIARLDQIEPERLKRMLADLESRVATRLQASLDGHRLKSTSRMLAIRYLGQSHDVPVQIPDSELDLQEIAGDFHQAHERLYGFSRVDQPVELVSLWVSVELDIQPLKLPRGNSIGSPPTPVAARSVIFQGQKHETAVFNRDDLGVGSTLVGPAIVEQIDTTTVIWPSERATVDQYGQLVLGAME